MVEEQSKQSHSGSIPIENESNSGNYVPSLVEKARNMTGERTGGLSGTQKTSAVGESSSLAHDELKNATDMEYDEMRSKIQSSSNMPSSNQ